MNAYLITYKASRFTQLIHTAIRFYPDWKTAYTESKRVLAETFPEVDMVSVELTADPRDKEMNE